MKDKPIDQQRIQFLAELLADIEDPQLMKNLLQDLCTLPELESLADRMLVARHLHAGLAYRKIQAITGVSLATITRVAKHLHHGHQGYSQALVDYPHVFKDQS